LVIDGIAYVAGKEVIDQVNLTHNLRRPVLRQTPFRFVVVIAFEVEKSQRGILGRGREKLTELQERSNY
jgi:hypothetical protein